MQDVWVHVSQIIALAGLFVPIHQALIELYKLLGAKRRRYWEALMYVVYGTSVRHGLATRLARWPGDVFRIVPSSLDEIGPGVRDRWRRGPQVDLIQSLLLRAVGDSPIADVSDRDTTNVVEIARLNAPAPIRRLSMMLGEMSRTQVSPTTALALLDDVRIVTAPGDWVEGFPARGDAWVTELRALVEGWKRELRALAERDPNAIVNRALVMLWEEHFNHRFFRAVVRARLELPNALKAAEYRYHEVLYRWSTALAVVEGMIIAHMSMRLRWVGEPSSLLLVGVIGFAAMVLGSRGSKSLLDGIIGVGTRLRG